MTEDFDSIGLDVLGARFDVDGTDADLNELRFFFREHLSTSGPAEFRLYVKSETGSFFRSVAAKDGALNEFGLVGSNNPGDVVQFRGWSGVPSPVPPLFLPKFASRFWVFPGAVLVDKSGRGVLLTGDVHVGKTAALIELLSIGWGLVTDQLVAVDVVTMLIYSYLTPVGFRRKNLQRFTSVLQSVDHRTTISEQTGPVSIAHLVDVIDSAKLIRQPQSIAWHVHLERDHIESAYVRQGGVQLPKPFGGDESRFVEWVSALPTTRVVVPRDAGPVEIAELIHSASEGSANDYV